MSQNHERSEFGSPVPTRKAGTTVHTYNPSLERQRQAVWLGSLAESMSYRFSERPCFKKQCDKQLRETTSASLWPPHICAYICVPSLVCTYELHTHTHKESVCYNQMDPGSTGLSPQAHSVRSRKLPRFLPEVPSSASTYSLMPPVNSH